MDVNVGFIFARLGMDVIWLRSYSGKGLVYVEHWMFGTHLDPLQSILINLYLSKCDLSFLFLFPKFHLQALHRTSLLILPRLSFIILDRALIWSHNRTLPRFKYEWLFMPIVVYWMNWVHRMMLIHFNRPDWFLGCDWTLFQWAFISYWNEGYGVE